MTAWKDIKFVQKIQIGFLLIAAIATIIVVNDLFRVRAFSKAEDTLQGQVNIPRTNIDKISQGFSQIQFTLLKFSIKEFEPEFPTFFQDVTRDKAKIDTLVAKLDIYKDDPVLGESVKNIKTIWKNYKNVVADAIISAGMMKDFEMAAVVATSSGEEVGKQLAKHLNQIQKHLQDESEEINGDLQKKTTASLYFIIFGMVIGTAIFLICAFWLAPTITLPIKKLSEELALFALGDYEKEATINSKDEFGELANMLEKVRLAQLEKIKAAQNIANGIFEHVPSASDKDILALSFNQMIDAIDDIFSETDKIIRANRDGDLKYRGNIQNFNGNWKQFVSGMNSSLESMAAPINEALGLLENIAKGDLTSHMETSYSGDYQRIADNLNQVVDNLGEAMIKVTEAASELSASASQISSSAEEMAAGATEQSTQTSEIASAVEEMAKAGSENTKNAKLASESAKKAGQKAKDSGEVIWKTINGINKLSDVMMQSANSVKELGKNSDQIGEIVQVIDDIADQTNLLALNAAIEAARAGEQGRGFAVVADEVRKLAERTSKATKEISNMIKKIQHDTDDAVHIMQQGTAEVEAGKALAAEASDALKEIIDITMDNAQRMEQLSIANEAQSAANDEISRVIEQIDNVSQQSAHGIQQISQSAENLYRLTGILQDMLTRFQLMGHGNSLKGSKQLYLGKN
jgi:methyl-accepting chemotaxis protein